MVGLERCCESVDGLCYQFFRHGMKLLMRCVHQGRALPGYRTRCLTVPSTRHEDMRLEDLELRCGEVCQRHTSDH